MRTSRTRTIVIVSTVICLFITAVSEAQTYCPPQQRTRQGLIFRLFRRSPPRRAQYYRPAPITAAPLITEPTIPAAPLAASTLPPSTVMNEPTLAPAPHAPTPVPTEAAKITEAKTNEEVWTSLFDGKSLGEWKSTEFGGEGEVDIKDGRIRCDFGQYMTGVTHSGKDIPTNNYEIELEAMREDGFDFFCGLTFPVDKNHASFIVGGWGGSVTGISSIDGMDASENSTTGYKVFKNKQWYKVRVRVTPGRLQTWVDDENFVDEEVTSDRLSTRIEVDRNKPLGIACFDTQASFRNIRIRKVTEPAQVD